LGSVRRAKWDKETWGYLGQVSPYAAMGANSNLSRNCRQTKSFRQIWKLNLEFATM
jgi:hypothetical protein